MRKALERFWQSSRTFHTLTLSEKILFYILCFFEPFYRCIFWIHQKYRRITGGYKINGAKVIGVGNISAGGTGKSVFTQFLVHNMPHGKRGALLLRGYKGKNEATGESVVVAAGGKMLVPVGSAGDEASMHAGLSGILVVAGKDRLKSAHAAREYCEQFKKPLDYLLLDDAYQNHRLNKNVECLLLDARFPFENGHCFPAGRLREKDCSRADFIIFTHAKSLAKQQREVLRTQFSQELGAHVFFGCHTSAGYFLQGNQQRSVADLVHQKIGVFAGIGSFQSFVNTTIQDGLQPVVSIEYSDHHRYSARDMKRLATLVSQKKVQAFVTTRKDWVKIASLVEGDAVLSKTNFYVLDVAFSFLDPGDLTVFFKLFCKKLGWPSD